MDSSDVPAGPTKGDDVSNEGGPTPVTEVASGAIARSEEAGGPEAVGARTDAGVGETAAIATGAVPKKLEEAPASGLDALNGAGEPQGGAAGAREVAGMAPAGMAPAAKALSYDALWTPSGWMLAVIAFVVAAADLGSKEWAKIALAGPDLRRTGKHVEVIRDHVDFIFAQNPGGAWSFLRSMPDGLRRPFFLFVSAAAIVFIVTVYRRLDRRQWAMRWGLPLALGGAIGNLADRVRYGWVVDFIDIYYGKGTGKEFHWPTFNVADVAIVLGVGMMALDLFSLRRMKDPPAGEPAPETASGAA